MKRIFTITLFTLLVVTSGLSQNLTQTVRGTILDADSKMSLIGAEIRVLGSDPLIGTVTDVSGNFRLENIPVGRVSLLLSYLGYQKATVSNIIVNSGKEVVLDLSMQESIVKMNEFVVRAYENKGEALNEMSVVSTRSISLEESKRYAGGFDDPSKILSNFAGVTSSQDGNNDIIVRGNSPKYMLWRLEGAEITNPNHFADQNGVAGGISALNNNLLATSDFATGAFAPEYGNVLSGVYDVKLRTGNNEKREITAGVGILGMDVAVEGPLKKGYGGSYLFNYRYSTISLVDNLGLVDVGGVPKFQDMAFKVVLPTKKSGTFSLFGLGGKSGIELKDITPAIWETPTDNGLKKDISEDLVKDTYLANAGINHALTINSKSFLQTSLSFAVEGLNDEIYESHIIERIDSSGQTVNDTLGRSLNFNAELKKSIYRGGLKYNYKVNAKSNLQIGSKFSLFSYESAQSMFDDNETNKTSLVDFNENMGVVNNFISWKYRLNEDVTVVSGFHNMNVLYTKESTLEPRIAVRWKPSNISSFNLGYGNHSKMESVHNYFTKVPDANGNITEPNKDLGLLKAHHFVAGYEHRLSENLRAKVEVYYQYLYNLPVENNDSSYYSSINEGLDYRYVDLVNEGTGENYGVELTLERFFNKNYYFLINTSLYSSTYKSLEGVKRNTAYNGNYLFNLLAGKEFVELGKNKNQTLAINAKLFYGGGKKIISLLRDGNGDLAVDPEKNEYWDYGKAYEDKIEDAFQMTLSASYKFNRKKATHEIFVNLENLTNHIGKINEFYDENEPNNIGYTTQFGFFPNVMYRVYF
jgi:hypothetical protein